MQIGVIGRFRFAHPGTDQSPSNRAFHSFRQLGLVTLANGFRVLTEGFIEHIPSCGLSRLP
jgi:hypothetical protein